MNSCIPRQQLFLQFHLPTSQNPKVLSLRGCSPRNLRIRAVSTTAGNQASSYIPAAPIFLPEGPWKQIPGGVTAAEGFKAAGMYGGLRAKGEKPDLALVTCDVDAISAGSFTTNVVAAAPVLYCKRTLDISKTPAQRFRHCRDRSYQAFMVLAILFPALTILCSWALHLKQSRFDCFNLLLHTAIEAISQDGQSS